MNGVLSKIYWFLGQLSTLKENNIIDDSTEGKLTEYYRRQIDIIKNQNDEKNKNRGFKAVIVILSIISSIFISGGIILLIAYNWRAIPRSVKTFCAFLILLTPQILSLYFTSLRKDRITKGLSEGLGLLWAVLFGGMVAFIGQIYKLPSNFGSFMLIWALSTLIIAYIFRSLSSFTLFLVMIVTHTIYSQSTEGVGILFYPLFFSIIPFYVMEERGKNIHRILYVKYLLIATLVSTLGVSLEKAVPGLWIPVYFNLFVLFFLVGSFLENREKNILYSPFKIAGTIGVYTTVFLLINPYFWKNIGWNFYRAGGRFNEYASIFDYGAAVILIALNIYIFFKKFYHPKKISPNIFFFSISALTVTVLYVLSSFNFLTALTASRIVSLVLLFVTAGYFYVGWSKEQKSSVLQNSLIFFLLLPVAVIFIAHGLDSDDRSGSVFLSLTLLFSSFYSLGKLFENEFQLKRFGVIKKTGIVGIALLAFAATFSGAGGEFDFRGWGSVSLPDVILEQISLLLFILLSFSPYVFFIKQKKLFHYIAPALPIIIMIIYYFNITGAGSIAPEALKWIMNLYILVFCLFSFYLSFKANSVLIANASAVFLTIAILSRFFDESMDILSRGVVFTFCGIFILILNIILSKRNKKKPEEIK